MHLCIDGPDGTILYYETDSPNVLLPLRKDERALAFHILTNALALLMGVTPQTSSDAKATETDQLNSRNSQSCDVRVPGVVVHLKARQDAATVPSIYDIDSRGELDR
jgi:hypothetical protein